MLPVLQLVPARQGGKKDHNGIDHTPKNSLISKEVPADLCSSKVREQRHVLKAVTCLVGVRLVRALRLAVSVITMVCGKRPVCVYWATSDLGP